MLLSLTVVLGVGCATLAAVRLSASRVRRRPAAAVLALALLATGCGSGPAAPAREQPAASPTLLEDAPSSTVAVVTTMAPAAPTAAPALATAPPPAPTWVLGATPLPKGPDGTPLVLPTPQALRDRRLPTVDRLPAPTADAPYASSAVPIDAALAARMGTTWQPGCPVALADLRYLRLSFWGFDAKQHTGELVVNAGAADDVRKVFGRLFAARFPIEEMRIVEPGDLSEVATGDGNGTAAFVCRPVRGSTSTPSAHAYGLAIDVNPFQNPYKKGASVLPELASSYLDRATVRPGMIVKGDVVTRAFAEVGWTWGGTWSSPKDLMHFSANGR